MAQWKFSSLAALADHLDNQASQKRESAKRFGEKSIRARDLISAAAEQESLAYMLRNAKIGP